MKLSERWQLKLSAKEQLRGMWGMMALRTLLLVLVPVGIIFAGTILCTILAIFGMMFQGITMSKVGIAPDSLTSIILTAIMFVIYIAAAFTGGLLDFGFADCCIKLRSGEPSNIGDLFGKISMAAKIIKLLLIMLVPTLPYIILTSINTIWPSILLSTLTFVFWIISIYMVLRMSMSKYILLENPYTTVLRAVAQSWHMMSGHCLRYFVLLLSFFGWTFLAAITIVGIFWLEPYIEMTNVNFYYDLKQYLLNKSTQQNI